MPYAPVLEQAVERRLAGLVAAERILQVGLLVEIGVRIEERDQLAAAHHELVDRVLGVFGDVVRMDHQQHLDVVVDLVRVQLDALDR